MMTFDENVSGDQACSVLKNVVKDGKLGSFNVDRTSIKPIVPKAQPENEKTPKGYCLFTPIIQLLDGYQGINSPRRYPSCLSSRDTDFIECMCGLVSIGLNFVIHLMFGDVSSVLITIDY